jgi:3-keto-disaccharide hydrolase
MSGIQKREAAFWVLVAAMISSGGLPWIASADGAEFRSLFNGHDLAGWSAIGAGAGEDWLVRDGCLVCQGKHHSWLRSSREYGDFRLVLEYQVAEGANSGVYVHVPADGNHHRDRSSLPPAGFEIQILDDHASRYAGLKDYQYSASLYDIAGASPRVSKPAGEWNKLEIQSVGLHVTVIHNEVRVVDARPQQFPLLTPRNKQGYFGLQSHNGVVRFRNLKIECLEKTAAGSTPAPSR